MLTTVSQIRLTDQHLEFISTMGRLQDLVSDPEVTIEDVVISEAEETTGGGEGGDIMDIEMITMIEDLHHLVIMTEAMIGTRETTMPHPVTIVMKRERDIPVILETVITSLTDTEMTDIESQDQVVDILPDLRTDMEVGVEQRLLLTMRGISTIRSTRETDIMIGMIGMKDHPVIITPAGDLLAQDLLVHHLGETIRGGPNLIFSTLSI